MRHCFLHGDQLWLDGHMTIAWDSFHSAIVQAIIDDSSVALHRNKVLILTALHIKCFKPMMFLFEDDGRGQFTVILPLHLLRNIYFGVEVRHYLRVPC